MEEIIQFLRDLALHNDREWFNAHKSRYQEVQRQWNGFCEELISEIGLYDEDIAKLTLRDCTYRIYRDTRFSNDKTPYKTHFGVFMAPKGKKSKHAGYYFHVSTGESKSYPHAHMLAVGNYCYDPKAVKILREDISDGWAHFSRDILGVMDDRFQVDWEDSLKKVPRDYPNDAPYADWMRLKSYSLDAIVDDDFVLQPHLAQRVARVFQSAKPFNDFINRAVDYVAEGE